MKALTISGLVFVQTHQSFPLHAYPNDYFRFSREALAGLFGTTMGCEVVATDYDFPAVIYSRREPETNRALAYLNTMLWAEKRTPTPARYRYELESPGEAKD
jgi:hypothetical protein